MKKGQKEIKGTTKPLMANLDISLVPRPSTPNAVEGLVKLLRRMTSGRQTLGIYMGRRWGYIWVDVGRRCTSGEVQSAAR